MRPIIKQIPRDFAGNISFSNYQEAKSLLVEQLGDYCSFCEKHNTANCFDQDVNPIPRTQNDL